MIKDTTIYHMDFSVIEPLSKNRLHHVGGTEVYYLWAGNIISVLYSPFYHDNMLIIPWREIE